MIRKHLNVAVVLLVGVVTQWGCRTNRDGLVQPANPISIDEARGWFEGKNVGARAGSTAPANRLVFWKYAQNDQLPNGTPVVVVPLLYGYNEPLMIGKGDYTLQAGKPAKLNGTKADVRIQKKLMVSKDDAGNYRSCVIVVIPSKDYRKQSSRVAKDRFDGVVQIYDENEEHYLLGLQYKNGKLKRVLRANSSAGGRVDEDCYMGTYQQNPPAQVGGGGRTREEQLSDQYGVPISVDFGDGSWFLTDVQPVSCDQGTPTNTPTYNPDAGMVDWIVRSGNSGDGGGTNPDPNAPIPVDDGMPSDSGPADAFTWEMQRNGVQLNSFEVGYFDQNRYLMDAFRSYVYYKNNNGSLQESNDVIIAVNDLKIKCVLDKMKNNSIFNNFLNGFVEDNRTDLFIQDGSNAGNKQVDTWGTTIPQPLRWDARVVMMNLDYNVAKNLTPIEIALTVLHESAHAKLFRKLLLIGGPGHLDEYMNKGQDFSWLYDQIKSTGFISLQHETIAEHYLNWLAFGLREFDNRQFSYEHYRALAWAGLKKTSAWADYDNKDEVNRLTQEVLMNRSKNCQL